MLYRKTAAELGVVLLSLASCSDHREKPQIREPPGAEASLVQELRVDGQEHDLVPFDHQTSGSVAVASDGTIALNQMQDHRVRFFGPDGEPLGHFGGEGAGPGEFRRSVQLGFVGDSLWVYDSGLNRVTVLTPHRELARIISLPRKLRPPEPLRDSIPESNFAFAVGVRRGGDVVYHVLPSLDLALPASERHTYFAAANGAGTITRVLTRIPVGETSVRVNGGVASIPGANRTVYAVSRDGRLSAFARADIDGRNSSFLLGLFGEAGDTLFAERYPIALVPLPGAVRDSLIERMTSRMGATALARAVREEAEKITVFPPLRDLVIGRDSTIWAALAHRDGWQPYVVVAPDGEAIGELRLDERSRIAEAERERIWVIEKDELDVESLVRYGVRW